MQPATQAIQFQARDIGNNANEKLHALKLKMRLMRISDHYA
jgi:hypothetical protein